MTSHASRQNSAPGRSSSFCMEYIKQPIALSEQIDKLRQRGLIIDDERLAKEYLANISYYRLRAYTYPFQDNTDKAADHKFIRNDIHFSDIVDLYCFDRRLRLLLFNAIEKIEVAIRARMTQAYADMTGNSHWFTDETLFEHKVVKDRNGNESSAFSLLQAEIEKEVRRSNEDFIKYYNSTYDNPPLPPSWMTLEVLSIGTLSRLYSLLLKSPTKTKIAKDLGLPNDKILANWLYAISICRNCCAHHSRIWNRRSLINVVLPYNTAKPFMDKGTIKKIHSNKIFAVMCCIKYISNTISPNSDLKRHFLSIIGDGGNLLNLQEMGFPANWKFLDVWKEN